MPTFRYAIASDASSLTYLFSHLLDRTFDSVQIDEFIANKFDRSQDGAHLFVLEVEKVVVASCQIIIYPNALRYPLKKAIIDSLVVAPAVRGKGYGKLILSHAIKFIEQCNVEIISVVSGYHRRAAHFLYESLGFSNYGKGYTLTLTSGARLKGKVKVAAPDIGQRE